MLVLENYAVRCQFSESQKEANQITLLLKNSFLKKRITLTKFRIVITWG